MKKNQYTQELSNRFHEQTAPDLLIDDKAKLKKEIIERAGLADASGLTVLDIGCAGGVHSKFIVDTFPDVKEVVGIDMSPEMIEIAKNENGDPKISYLVSDMDTMPFSDEKFDFIFSRNTTHYSENLEVTFKEMYRVLRPGGKLYLQDTHPLYAFLHKPSKDYEIKENVGFPIQGGTALVYHPTSMFSEYINAIVHAGFTIIEYKEFFGRSSQVGEFRTPSSQGFLLQRN